MTVTRPDPLTPPDSDLRGLEWMPLYGHRLFGSDFDIHASDGEFRAGMNLWWSAWNQVPSASLPNDETALCRLAGCGRDLKAWRRVKARALHGFIECGDGRLYHQAQAPFAIEAWERRQISGETASSRSERQARWRARVKEVSGRLRDLGVVPPAGATLETLEEILRSSTVDADRVSTETSTETSTRASTETSTSPSTQASTEMHKTRPDLTRPDLTGSKNPTPPPSPGAASVDWAGCGRSVKAILAEHWPDDQRLELTDTGICAMWLADGWDLELDILPTVRALSAAAQAKGNKPANLKYFTSAIARRHAERLAGPPEPASRGAPASAGGALPADDPWESRVANHRQELESGRAEAATTWAKFVLRWGEMPGHRRCEAPPEILQKHGFSKPKKDAA